jgi:ribosomal protein L7/L12
VVLEIMMTEYIVVSGYNPEIVFHVYLDGMDFGGKFPRVEAIKYLRDKCGFTLHEAKEYVCLLPKIGQRFYDRP